MVATALRPDLLLDQESVEAVRETHISWVFLTRDRAYKVKKPLVLPYVDYGTPARRLAMCRAEVALNRRLAPDVYLGVRSLIPAPDGRLELGSESCPDAVDYAVEMRRYPEDATLARRIAAGTAGPVELEAIGARLARFHAEAVCERRPDGAEAVKRALDDNFATLRSLLREPSERRAVASSERFASAFLASVWGELDRRAAGGRIRDGHGDLRLEHVLLERDVEVVDCVEFDDGLRHIDVAADLAFLVMELHEADRPDLAAALVSGYRAAGGDPGSDALLAFLAAYRAQVRAKVALTRAQQLPPDAGPARHETAHAAALLRLADRLQWAARTPLVVVIAGISASGKTTLAASPRRRVRVHAHQFRRRAQARSGPRAERPGTACALRQPRRIARPTRSSARWRREAAPAGVIVDATSGTAPTATRSARSSASAFRCSSSNASRRPLCWRRGRGRGRRIRTARRTPGPTSSAGSC